MFAVATREANFTPLAGLHPAKTQQKPSKVNHFPRGRDAAKSRSRFLCDTQDGVYPRAAATAGFTKTAKYYIKDEVLSKCRRSFAALWQGDLGSLTSSSGFLFTHGSKTSISQMLYTRTLLEVEHANAVMNAQTQKCNHA